MLSELAKFGEALSKIEYISSSQFYVIEINVNEEEFKGITVSTMHYPDCLNKLGFDPTHNERNITGTLEYPVGFCKINKKKKVSAIKSRIINWFKKHKEYSRYGEIINKNKEEIEERVIEEYEKINKDLKTSKTEAKIIVTVKISGKYPKECLQSNKNKETEQGFCYVCHTYKNNIAKDYKDISKVFYFYTLDKPGYAPYFDKRLIAASLPICLDCLENIKRGIDFWVGEKKNEIKFDDNYIMIIPIRFNESEFKNFIERDHKNGYLGIVHSIDTIFDNLYIVYSKNLNQFIAKYEYIVKKRDYDLLVKKNENIRSLYSGFRCFNAEGLIEFIKCIANYLIPIEDAFKNLKYYKKDVYDKAIRFTFDAVLHEAKLPEQDVSELIKASNNAFKRMILFSLEKENKKRYNMDEKISDFSMNSLYLKLLLINMEVKNEEAKNMEANGEEANDSPKKGIIMKLLDSGNFSPAEKFYIFVGMLVGGVAKLQEKLGYNSSILEKATYLPNQEKIRKLYEEAKGKFLSYRSYESDYKEIFNKLYRIDQLISELVIANSEIKNYTDTDKSVFYFYIGLGLARKYFFDNDNKE